MAFHELDPGMDDFAHDARNVLDPVGRGFEKGRPRSSTVFLLAQFFPQGI